MVALAPIRCDRLENLIADRRQRGLGGRTGLNRVQNGPEAEERGKGPALRIDFLDKGQQGVIEGLHRDAWRRVVGQAGRLLDEIRASAARVQLEQLGVFCRSSA